MDYNKLFREGVERQRVIMTDKSIPLSKRIEDTIYQDYSTVIKNADTIPTSLDSIHLSLTTLHVDLLAEAIESIKELEKFKKDLN